MVVSQPNVRTVSNQSINRRAASGAHSSVQRSYSILIQSIRISSGADEKKNGFFSLMSVYSNSMAIYPDSPPKLMNP